MRIYVKKWQWLHNPEEKYTFLTKDIMYMVAYCFTEVTN